MTRFTAHDGTELAYHVYGDGAPVVCLPGGPMQDSVYLGDLGGLSAQRKLVVMDLRGTGQSAVPEDTASYRCDRLVDDVERLREQLELDRMDLLAHSAGANLAALYAERHRDRVGKLALITPSVMAVGVPITTDLRRESRGFAETSRGFQRRSRPWRRSSRARRLPTLPKPSLPSGTTAGTRGLEPIELLRTRRRTRRPRRSSSPRVRLIRSRRGRRWRGLRRRSSCWPARSI
jgi:pimeloyl-ACP methyl ester carboxylesterase